MASCIQSYRRLGYLAHRHAICLRCTVKKYIRTDTFKVFEKEDQILQSIIEKKKLSAKQGKSEAYRVSLHSYEDLHNIPTAVEEMKAILQQVLEEQKQSYFVNQALVAQVAELRQVNQALVAQVAELRQVIQEKNKEPS
jgi:hypothetical protein